MDSRAALLQGLLDIGDGLQAQMIDLHQMPTPERCERLAINLEGARRSVLALRERLMVEPTGDGR